MSIVIPDNLAAAMGRIDGVDRIPVALDVPFIDFAARFAHLPGSVVLLSGGELDCARYHLLGALPWLTLSSQLDHTRLMVDGQTHRLHGDPLAVLKAVLTRLKMNDPGWALPMAAGLMGYLAYDLKDTLEALPRTSVDDLQLPVIYLTAPSLLVIHDKIDGRSHLLIPRRRCGRPWSPDALCRHFERLAGTAKTPDNRFEVRPDSLAANFDQAGYESAVARIIDYIAAGDVYQVNMSQRFRARCRGDAYDLFKTMYSRNPAPFYAYVHAGDHQVVSTSMERFLLRCGEQVETRPIKGTRPRGNNPKEDERLRQQLSGSAKDDAELSMIVDLLRNDIGKVCRAGSVKVDEHKRIEAYANVYHLVSVVTGRLDAGMDSVDLIAATFPGGSITGCPKVRAMEIIDELETCRRHIYTGAIGYISFHDTMDLSIAIRTATVTGDTMLFSVGGGVVFDSDPTDEFHETLHKGKTLMSVFDDRHAGHSEGPARIWCNGQLIDHRHAAVPVDSPGFQYGEGFFETLRAEDGHIHLLADHQDRFQRTWQALMPGRPPDITWETVIHQVLTANGLLTGSAAVKLIAARGKNTTAPHDHFLAATARPYTHRLAGRDPFGLRLGTYPHPRQNPLADYKTLNYLYYLRAGRWAKENGFDEALIANPDGSVSETNTANLLLICDRQVIRPASPAVLDGVMARAAVRRLRNWGFDIRTAPVTIEQLASADQVLATNALMGVVPVIAIDEHIRPVGGSLWQRLIQAIWQTAKTG